jgi:hypothetical protein
MKFDILNEGTGRVLFTVEIGTWGDAGPSRKLGRAVLCAVKAKADLGAQP